MDPSGSYTTSPGSWSGFEMLHISSDITKEYTCSDHFFVISSTSSFGSWSWGTQTDRIKVVWNCDTLYIYHPTSSVSQPSGSQGLHHIDIEYTTTSISVTTDLDYVSLSATGTYWDEVWLWIGADDDAPQGSDFANTVVNP